MCEDVAAVDLLTHRGRTRGRVEGARRPAGRRGSHWPDREQRARENRRRQQDSRAKQGTSTPETDEEIRSPLGNRIVTRSRPASPAPALAHHKGEHVSSTSRQPDSASRGGAGLPAASARLSPPSVTPRGHGTDPDRGTPKAPACGLRKGRTARNRSPRAAPARGERGRPGGPCPGSGGLRTPLARLFQLRHGHTGHVLAGSRRWSSLRPVAACSQEFRTNVAFAAFAIIL